MSGWSSTWKDILNGGNPRWKITSGESHEKAYAHFRKHVLKDDTKNNNEDDDDIKNISVLCPLAGDDPFVHLLYRKGYSVTAIDLVAEALEEMRQRFGDDDGAWTKEESDGDIVWTHANGRATLIAGDALKKRVNLKIHSMPCTTRTVSEPCPRTCENPFAIASRTIPKKTPSSTSNAS